MMSTQPLSEEMLEALRHPRAYPLDGSAASGIEVRQTHISYVFLSRERAYKLRKAVLLPFLSFATRAQRDQDCLREVDLNRRLAPDVYLGVAAVRRLAGGRWEVGPAAECLEDAPVDDRPGEHCVVMRRLADRSSALALLRRGELTRAHVEAVAEMLVEFHATHGLGIPAPYEPRAWLDRTWRVVEETLEVARGSGCDRLEPALLDRCEQLMRRLFERRRNAFEARRRLGRVVDGHGDLHLDHVYFEHGPEKPIAIDCIEFSEDLRRVDVAAELAFFAMDLVYRDRADLAEQFLRCYASLSDDYGLYPVIDHHVAHRALVRAAVAGVAASEKEIRAEKRRAAAGSAEAHLELVWSWLQRRPRSLLILTCGQVGTGKSSVADRVADLLGAVVVSSDRTRKQLAGVRPEQRARAAPGEGIYTEERTRAVYAALLERATPVLESGRPVILDATYSKAEQREAARRWSAERGCRALLLEVQCDAAVARERLVRREADPRSISDAGPRFQAESARRFEPPVEWPAAEHLVVRTDRSNWREDLVVDLEKWIGHVR